MLDKFAEELKKARQSSEITLQQIAAKTRIDFKFLESLENGNFSFLPELYVKAFIREYARMVGLDPEETVVKYEAAKKGKDFGAAEPQEGAKEEKTEPGGQPAPKPNKPAPAYKSYESDSGQNNSGDSSSNLNKKKLILLGSIAGAVILALIIYFGFIRGSSDIIVKEKPIEQIIKENRNRYEEEPSRAAADTVKSVPAARNLTLSIQATDTAWIKVMIDNGMSEEFTLMPGSRKEIYAGSEFEMIVGSAGALSLKLNNKDLDLKGSLHEVKYLSIDASGLKYLKDPPKFTRE